jgi:hypothetical protein
VGPLIYTAPIPVKTPMLLLIKKRTAKRAALRFCTKCVMLVVSLNIKQRMMYDKYWETGQERVFLEPIIFTDYFLTYSKTKYSFILAPRQDNSKHPPNIKGTVDP